MRWAVGVLRRKNRSRSSRLMLPLSRLWWNCCVHVAQLSGVLLAVRGPLTWRAIL